MCATVPLHSGFFCFAVWQGWSNIFYGGPHWRFYCYRGPHVRITYITSIIALKP